jgi:cell division protein FtsB
MLKEDSFINEMKSLAKAQFETKAKLILIMKQLQHDSANKSLHQELDKLRLESHELHNEEKDLRVSFREYISVMSIR